MASFARPAKGAIPYSHALQLALRRLDALVNWEHLSRLRGTQRVMRVSTKPAVTLLAAVGDPQRSFRSVHVTGSKGKGSVSALVAAGLSASGAPTGVYGSPHVERVNERIRLDNYNPIGDDELANALDGALDARDRHAPDATWFDVMSVAGLLAFRSAGLSWAVVEVGMGGRLDSTNVLSAPVAIVTNISLEHQDIIGPTIQDIAYEKAGIFSKGCQPIVGMREGDELASIFVNEAANVGAERPAFIPLNPGEPIRYHNIALARRALAAALPAHNPGNILPDDVAEACLAALPARMERFSVSANALIRECGQLSNGTERIVEVLLDGAHVASSVRTVLAEAKRELGSKLVVMLALGREKDVHGICKAIAESNPVSVIATCVGNEDRYLPSTDLAAHCASTCIGNLRVCDEPVLALGHAVLDTTKLRANLVVLGSLHLAGKVRSMLVASQQARIESVARSKNESYL